jgi:hypothetical protein
MSVRLPSYIAGVQRNYQPIPPDPIPVWAKRTLRFTAAQSRQYHGRAWDIENVPHTSIIFDFLDDPTARELHIEKSSAAAFSTAILVGICWYLKFKPCRVLYALNNASEMRKVSKAILQPFLRQTFGDVLIDDKKQAALFIQLPRGAVIEMGSPTEGFWANKQASIIVGDEYDIWPDELEGGATDPLSAMRGRFKGSESFAKLLTLTAPQRKYDPARADHHQPGTKQDQAFLSGDQREFRIVCPGCGKWFAPSRRTLHFEHLRLPKPGVVIEPEAPHEPMPFDMRRVRKETALKCPECSRLIFEGRGPEDKPALVRAGQWFPTCATNPPDIWSASYNDTCAIIGNSQLGVLAGELITARSKSRHALVNVLRARFAEPESDEDVVDLSLEHARKHCAAPESEHKRGSCPIDPWFIGMVVDCQKGTTEQQPLLFKWVKKAFKTDGTAYVVDYGSTSSATDLRAEYETPIRYSGPDLEPPPPPPVPPGGKKEEPLPFNARPTLYCRQAVIDSGYRTGANPQEEQNLDHFIYPLCISWGYRDDGHWQQTMNGWHYTGTWHLIPLKGRSREQMQSIGDVKSTTVNVAHSQFGQVVLPLHLFHDWNFKAGLYHGTLAADPDNINDPRLRRYPRLYLPCDTDDSFLSEITSERLVDVVRKIRGHLRTERIWKTPSKAKNDYGDCIKMGRVLWTLMSSAAVAV